MPRWAAPLLLAVLCARALIPAGVMLAPVHGRLDVVLCDIDGANAARHVHEHTGHHHSQTDPTCPYAQSAGPAPLPALPVLPVALLRSDRVPPALDAQTFSRFGPTRQQTSRGPPSFT